jgi:hypothetical protein
MDVKNGTYVFLFTTDLIDLGPIKINYALSITWVTLHHMTAGLCHGSGR